MRTKWDKTGISGVHIALSLLIPPEAEGYILEGVPQTAMEPYIIHLQEDGRSPPLAVFWVFMSVWGSWNSVAFKLA